VVSVIEQICERPVPADVPTLLLYRPPFLRIYCESSQQRAFAPSGSMHLLQGGRSRTALVRISGTAMRSSPLPLLAHHSHVAATSAAHSLFFPHA
jgi:hypothetical protein